ncbi:MAG: patatin-like phospholipase family protein [Haliscomenobacter sp.]|uniref:patatin-like phospholipase family protein n=1 Tax=Haliscomenobacter sp. TaxID=2717303 RepID=UPI0029A8C089|nr:patatin-like phospholipase family protein [Haliscomenobacter sp.]MDX2072392.1 patatin-like phospholipase family protein [Haliscomenobacter sp.]
MQNRKIFKIGIAMAGAVSAGAYTAGVIDYLLETLEKWDRAKKLNEEVGEESPMYDFSVPMHDVVIEVIGGASAGGMTAAIAALAMFEGIKPINEYNPEKKQNKLYDSWVNLNDAQGLPTIEQMLQTGDILAKNEVQSLLNSDPIDAIADNAGVLSQIQDLPEYISPNLQIILTITSLRGVPVAVNFFDNKRREELKAKEELSRDAFGSSDAKDQPAHRMYVHKGIAHFMVASSPSYGELPEHVIPFKPTDKDNRNMLMDCAKATGAFPLGLKSRPLSIGLPYIKAMVYRMFGLKNQSQMEQAIEITAEDSPYNFVAVDGGTINNEPFGEIIDAIEEKCKKEESPYAIIMIDPFPNFAEDKSKKYKQPTSLLDLIPDIFGAIRAQAMVKENDLLRGLAGDVTRRMVFPKKNNDPYPIACGALDGFGGFFSREFREHDFQLGRYNCQKFLRKHFTIPLNKLENAKVFSDWKSDGNDPRHERFFVPNDLGGPGFYPIIPDMGIANMAKSEYHEAYLPEPVKLKIHPNEIFKLDALLSLRFKTVLDYIFALNTPPDDHYNKPVHQDVDRLMREYYGDKERKAKQPSFLKRVFLWAWRTFLTRMLGKNIAKRAIKIILLDFRERDMLEM